MRTASLLQKWLRFCAGRNEWMKSVVLIVQSAVLALCAAIFLMLRPLLDPGTADEWHGTSAALVGYALIMLVVSMVRGIRAQQCHSEALAEASAERARTHELFTLTDMLQSADSNEDALAVLRAASLRLLPQFGAALYVFNNSRDRLDLVGSWGMPEGAGPAEILSPTNCWALKRGKFHINDAPTGTLCCGHHRPEVSTIEIPMAARGSVYGLLLFATDRPGAFEELRGVQRLGRMLADSMSLALSNIALREKLRTQSLRDPLTGLYNRRYMEDSLERYTSLAERSGSSTAVIMIDLDHFKALNDVHGHAKGDAVLRDVAAQLVGGVRPSDVVCRYGGEELLVILPDCGIEDAAARAEVLRGRIEALGQAHGATVSASFGVAAIPDTSATHVDIVAMADNALYLAKQQGRNRVICAEPRPGRDERVTRLAAAR